MYCYNTASLRKPAEAKRTRWALEVYHLATIARRSKDNPVLQKSSITADSFPVLEKSKSA